MYFVVCLDFSLVPNVILFISSNRKKENGSGLRVTHGNHGENVTRINSHGLTRRSRRINREKGSSPRI